MNRNTRLLLLLLVTWQLVTGVAGVLIMGEDRKAPAAADDPSMLLAAADARAVAPGERFQQVPVPTTEAPRKAPAARVVRDLEEPLAPTARARSAGEPIVHIGTIEIPKIGLRHDVYHGITMRNIDRGPSHWPGTPFPGEASGNTVFMGHRVTKTRPFFHIEQLVPGDKVYFTVQGERSVYVVTGHEIVTPREVQRVVRQTSEPTGTIFACHPKGSAKYRYVVRLALSGE